MHRLVFLLMLTAAPWLATSIAYAQKTMTPQNVRVTADEQRIVVRYDLDGPKNRKATVLLRASKDGGETWTVVPRTVKGDFGKNVRVGAGREIVWYVLADYPHGLEAEQFVIEVEAVPQKSANFAKTMAGASVVGAGTAVAYFLISKRGPDTEPVKIALPPGRPATQ